MLMLVSFTLFFLLILRRASSAVAANSIPLIVTGVFGLSGALTFSEVFGESLGGVKYAELFGEDVSAFTSGGEDFGCKTKIVTVL